ncbi:MAG: cytochrome-c peroxidase [Acidobacteriota bacterium]|nr:cytochrome-c peroxidase [Acidobacteriota bacterium]
MSRSRAPILLLLAACLVPAGNVLAKKPDGKPTHGTGALRWLAVQDTDFLQDGRFDAGKVELGRLLFFDKILSGNENVSCATCHHPLTATGDGLSLPVGEGGHGLGVTRDTGSGADAVVERVPRNAPHVFNLGAREFRTMFHDGRVRVRLGHPSEFETPAGDDLPPGLENVLAAQAMFPVTSLTEMAGQPEDGNEIALAAHEGRIAGDGGVWDLLAARLRANDEYADLFADAFDDVFTAEDITFVHAANAIAAFEASAWRADDSPFDRFLHGDRSAMSQAARRGMILFYGRANCASCHSGSFQTDHRFHATAMPQIGPGKGVGFDGLEDFGRELVTGDPADRYRFRTPSLRNVALTGPWGHSGAYDTLEGIVRHMLGPLEGLMGYDPSQAMLPSRSDLDESDFVVMTDPDNGPTLAAIATANEIRPASVSERELADIVEFLHALTDRGSLDLRRDVPAEVPSGLPLAE